MLAESTPTAPSASRCRSRDWEPSAFYVPQPVPKTTLHKPVPQSYRQRFTVTPSALQTVSNVERTSATPPISHRQCLAVPLRSPLCDDDRPWLEPQSQSNRHLDSASAPPNTSPLEPHSRSVLPETQIHEGELVPPTESLEHYLREGGTTLIQAAFAHSYFAHPDRVRGNTPLYPDRARRSREHYPTLDKGTRTKWQGRQVKLDDNSKAQRAWASYSGRPIQRASGYGVRHVWGHPWNPDAFTAGWNLCYMPFWAGMLTERQHPQSYGRIWCTDELSVRRVSAEIEFARTVSARGAHGTWATIMWVSLAAPAAVSDPLTALLRAGARRLIEAAVSAEFGEYLSAFEEEKLPDGRRRMVRNGHRPPRTKRYSTARSGGACTAEGKIRRKHRCATSTISQSHRTWSRV